MANMLWEIRVFKCRSSIQNLSKILLCSFQTFFHVLFECIWGTLGWNYWHVVNSRSRKWRKLLVTCIFVRKFLTLRSTLDHTQGQSACINEYNIHALEWQNCKNLFIDEVLPSLSTPGERKIITLTSVGFEPATFGWLVQRSNIPI